jgi:SOS-response transcriptional repressor LexA
MNETQQKLIALASSKNLAQMPLREIAQAVGVATPQLAQHHINQLIRKGLLWIDRRAGKMKLLTEDTSGSVMRIPILGAANCGPALQFANDEIEGYLPIAPSLLGLKSSKTYFAVRAVGNSMNRAKILTLGGQKTGINDGDLVVAEKSIPSTSNPYIIAVVDGLANIKKLVLGNGYARLESESSMKYAPIYLEPNLDSIVAGQVVGVVKG